MSSKTGRRANAAAAKAQEVTIEGQKDDGTRWIVVSSETGKAIYSNRGVTKFEANRLARGLAIDADIKQVDA